MINQTTLVIAHDMHAVGYTSQVVVSNMIDLGTQTLGELPLQQELAMHINFYIINLSGVKETT